MSKNIEVIDHPTHPYVTEETLPGIGTVHLSHRTLQEAQDYVGISEDGSYVVTRYAVCSSSIVVNAKTPEQALKMGKAAKWDGKQKVVASYFEVKNTP